MKQLINICLLLLCVGMVHAQSMPSNFGTLFTTESERNIINANRYVIKKKKRKNPTATKIEVIDEKPIEVITETIEKEFKISGISIANNGVDSAWINGKLFASGESVEEKIKLKINPSKKQVRIIAPDGKSFYGKSGDTVKVSYQVIVKE